MRIQIKIVAMAIILLTSFLISNLIPNNTIGYILKFLCGFITGYYGTELVYRIDNRLKLIDWP